MFAETQIILTDVMTSKNTFRIVETSIPYTKTNPYTKPSVTNPFPNLLNTGELMSFGISFLGMFLLMSILFFLIIRKKERGDEVKLKS